MTTALHSSLTAAWSLWTNQNALQTNEFASFCIDNRLRQMPFSWVCQNWENIQSTLFQLTQTKFCIICLFIIIIIIKQIDSIDLIHKINGRHNIFNGRIKYVLCTWSWSAKLLLTEADQGIQKLIWTYVFVCSLWPKTSMGPNQKDKS